jgi:hypothetical protein
MATRLFWLAALAATVAAAGCFSDDDDDSGGIEVNCNPTACDDITGSSDCQAYEDRPDVFVACGYCLQDTLESDQIAECMLDFGDQATGDALRDGCIEFVQEQCRMAKS